MPHAWRHLILFDGLCGLCSRAVQFVLARNRSGTFAFAPLQSAIARSIANMELSPDLLGTFILVEHYGTENERVLVRSAAALSVCAELGWPWSMCRAFGVLPTALLDRIYDRVAANRYRLFGRHAQCFIPRPEDRNRFIDASPR